MLPVERREDEASGSNDGRNNTRSKTRHGDTTGAFPVYDSFCWTCVSLSFIQAFLLAFARHRCLRCLLAVRLWLQQEQQQQQQQLQYDDAAAALGRGDFSESASHLQQQLCKSTLGFRVYGLGFVFLGSFSMSKDV